MNQFISNLVCEGFHHVLLKYSHENAEMQKRKFDDVTLQYSIEFDLPQLLRLKSQKVEQNLNYTLDIQNLKSEKRI